MEVYVLLQTVLKNKEGLTLIEVMIALVVLLLVFLALMQTALVSIDSNMINVLRDEAVNIAEERMNNARNAPFDTLASLPAAPVSRNIRNVSNFQYSVVRTVSALNIDSRQVVITVSWNWKARPYVHTISSILRKR
jgi:prepilin-type N-terminal cleavage/methylation domain-containing protein